jgi:flagellar protein FliS
MGYGLGAYKKTSITTASREEVLLMLYRGAIKEAKKAINALEEKNIKAKAVHIGKFQDIIIELADCLDYKVDETENITFVKDLARLYEYIIAQATQSSFKIDPEPMKECLSLITTLYEGWVQAVNQLKRENSLPR